MSLKDVSGVSSPLPISVHFLLFPPTPSPPGLSPSFHLNSHRGTGNPRLQNPTLNLQASSYLLVAFTQRSAPPVETRPGLVSRSLVTWLPVGAAGPSSSTFLGAAPSSPLSLLFLSKLM